MNELKAIQVLINGQPFDLYFKSDTDKVIAEKDKVIAYARALVREDIKLIARQKYKRCVAMAMLCRSLACFYDTMRENGLYWVWKSDRTYKWYKRWLELAEEPTWARFLQLIRKETK